MGVASGMTVALARKAYHLLENLGNLAEEGYEDIEQRALLSMLVHWCYYRDINWTEKSCAWFMDYNNKRARDYGMQHWEPYPCIETEAGLKCLGVSILRRRLSHSNPNAPGLAIAIRGTILTKWSDVSADLVGVGLQRLNKSDRVCRTLTLILDAVRSFRSECPGERICMAGHSLGAAIALIIGATLYDTHEIDIETHLFNPPLVTVLDLVARWVFPSPPTDIDRVGKSRVEAKFKEQFARLFRKKAAMDDEWVRFKRMRNWKPHFYLNAWDPFCHQYINLFKRQVETLGAVISSQGLFSNLFSKQATIFLNVVPCAHVHISKWKAGHPILAHSNQQWYKFKTKHIQLQSDLVDLVGPAG